MKVLFPPSVYIVMDLTFFLILTLELLQDNYLEYNTALPEKKKAKKKKICPQLKAELKCQNQHLFLKSSQCPQTCNFRRLSHHLAALHNTYTCTVTISNQLAVQIGNRAGQANRMPPVPTALFKPDVMLAKMQTDSSWVPFCSNMLMKSSLHGYQSTQTTE